MGTIIALAWSKLGVALLAGLAGAGLHWLLEHQWPRTVFCHDCWARRLRAMIHGNQAARRPEARHKPARPIYRRIRTVNGDIHVFTRSH